MEKDKGCSMWQEDTGKIKKESLGKGYRSGFDVLHLALSNKKETWENEPPFHRNLKVEMDEWCKQQRPHEECVCWDRLKVTLINEKNEGVQAWWFGHVKLSLDSFMCKIVAEIKTEGKRPRKKWWEVIKEDTLACGVTEDTALNRALGRERTHKANAILWNECKVEEEGWKE